MTVALREPARGVWSSLERALLERRAVQVIYHDRCRLICPHALGWKHNRPMVLAYQAEGLTTTGSHDARKAWRCMFVDEIDQVMDAQPSASWRTADNYNPSRPFSAIDHVAVAVGRAGQHASPTAFDPMPGAELPPTSV